MKAIIIARVSTEEQLKEGQSIPAQLRRTREYYQRKRLEIKSEYQFEKFSNKGRRKKKAYNLFVRFEIHEKQSF